MRRPLLRVLVAATALALLLAACAPGNNLEREPHSNGVVLPTADTSAWQLPLQLNEQTVYQTGWVTEPQELDGIFLAPREADGSLEFIAVDSSGQVRWSAQRPISCTGFVLARTAQGQSLAILSDVSTTKDALAATTASAYDLATGQLVWGPVQVPGPHQGPGLVYAAAAQEPIGPTGTKIALDPSTGKVTAAETEDSDQQIIGEYDGLVLSATDTGLDAVNSSGSTIWQVRPDELGGDLTLLRAAVGQSTDRAHAVVQLAHQEHALMNLEDGTVLATGFRQVHTDAVTGIHLLLTGNQMRALDRQGEQVWSLSTDGQTSIAGPGDALVFLRSGGAVRVHNIATGDIVQGYPANGEGLIALPVLLSESGAAIVTDHAQFYLVASPGSID